MCETTRRPYFSLRMLTVLLLGFVAQGCAKGGDDNTVQASNGPKVLSCKSSVIDSGQKGSVAVVARGVYSDTKLIPGSSSPATAFADPTAIGMKISFWNGSQFTTEIISGDGAGSFVRLVFAPNGVPYVFWTLGANLKVAIRSGPFSAPGKWQAGVIDSGVAPRAVEASVSPLGQILVSFLTDTAVTGRVKVLYCGSSCTSPSMFQTMSPNPYVENTNLNAAETSTGAAWCQASASTFYPVVTYSVTGSTRYAVCLNTPSNCLNSSSWSFQTISATANLGTKVLIDSNMIGDVPKVVSFGASGITPYKMGTTSCALPPGAFTAGTAMGTATSGSLWMSFLKDSSNKFHLLANEGTTAVKYYNSTTTDPVSSWNTAGVVEATTLNAASGGGADLDSATNGIYVSYGMNVVPFDLHLGKVTDYTQVSSAATFTHLTPDLSGNLQLSAAASQLKNISTSSNNELTPGVAYVDFSVGSTAGAKLKFALRSGATSSSVWNSYLIPGTINPQFPSLAFDGNDRPWVSYFEAATNKYFLVTSSSADGSGNWSAFEFPAPSSGAPAALPAANNTALTMMNLGGVKSPLLTVLDTNAVSKGVKAAYFNMSSRTWSAVTTVDGLTGGALGAAHISVDADHSGNVVLAYQDLNLTRVKYATSNGGVSWTNPITISSPNQGAGTSVKINPMTGWPSVSYFDQTNNLVLYSACGSSVSACSQGGWSPIAIEGAAGVSGVSLASGQLVSTSLVFDLFGSPSVSYPRGQTNDSNFVLWNNQSGNFMNVIEGTGANGNLVGTPALNFAISGWGVSTTLNSVGGATSVYIGPGDWLYANSCGD